VKDGAAATGLRRSLDVVARVLRPYRARLAAITGLAAIGSVAESAALVAVAVLATAFVGGESARPTLPLLGDELGAPSGPLIVFALAAVVVRLLAFGGAVRIAAGISADYERARRREIVDAYLGAEWELQSQQPPGAFQDLLTWDVEGARSAVDAVARGLAALVGFAILVLVAFAVSPGTAVVVVAAAAVLAVLLRPVALVARRLAARRADVNSAWADDIQQTLSVAREIQVFGVTPFFRARTSRLLDQVAAVRRLADFVSGSAVVLYQTTVLLGAVVALGIVYLVDVGLLREVGPIALLLIRALGYSQSVQQVLHTVVEREPYLRRLQDKAAALEARPQAHGSATLDRVESVAFRHVTFAYAKREPALLDVSFEARPGEAIALVGPSGSGKSTLVQLLLRLLRPGFGVVLVNGRPVDDYSDASWAQTVTYVPQEPVLLRLSVADNIRFGRPGISAEAVRLAAARAYVADEIEALPRGYDEPCGERGSRLSGGQRQRICIARALVTQPNVIVFDEPTSALDPVSEQFVLRTLAEMRGNATLFIVTHRPETLELCDRALVLDHGRLRAFARPAELPSAGD
jgi:ATP-binding cassette subfamily B protein